MKDDAAIIEVALNEAVSPSTNARVPRAPERCATDALRCAEAGAAIVHWHAVDSSGVQRLADTSLYGETLDAIDARILAYPSYPTDVPDTVAERLGLAIAAGS